MDSHSQGKYQTEYQLKLITSFFLAPKLLNSDIFSHLKSGKSVNCAWAYARLRIGKRAKVAGN